MRINRNIAANYASRLWAGISTFVFVPVYLRILGPEAFGLVMFSTSILGVVFILDMGMSNSFAREMARETDRLKLANLLRSLEWLYLGVVLLVLLIAALTSGWIADYWLNVSQLPHGKVRWSVALMLVSAVLQVMMALYLGGLLGANRHVAAAKYQIGFGIVRSGVVLIPLFFWPAVELVFVWQITASLLGLLLLRRTVWRVIAPLKKPRFSRSALRAIGAFAGGMFAIALISAVNTQSDKIVVSKLFSLDELGFYVIASLIGQIPSLLALPLAITVLPRLTGHVTRGERSDLFAVYMRYSFMISVVAFTAAIGVIVGAPQILMIIKGNAPAPELVAISRVLAIGGAFLAVQYMPYHLAVASGHTRTNILFGSVSAIALPIAIFVGAARIGLLGAAIPWVVMNAVAATFLAWRITPRFLGPHLAEWTWKANFLPLAVSAAVICPAHFILPIFGNPFEGISILALFCTAAITINGAVLIYFFRDHPEARAPSTEAWR